MTRPTPKYPVGSKVRSSGLYPEAGRLEGLTGTVTDFTDNPVYEHPYEVDWHEADKHEYLHSEDELEAAE